jgi:hypothetical protein
MLVKAMPAPALATTAMSVVFQAVAAAAHVVVVQLDQSKAYRNTVALQLRYRMRLKLGDAGVIAGKRLSVDDARSDAQPRQASTIRRRRAMAFDHRSYWPSCGCVLLDRYKLLSYAPQQ